MDIVGCKSRYHGRDKLAIGVEVREPVVIGKI